MLEVGLRVVRGPHWSWENEDGGEGYMGTVYKINDTEKSVVVQWDNGYQTQCKIGYMNMYELRVIDNAQIGIKHKDIYCNECNNGGIKGTRYKCNNCPNYDLCNYCYHENKHYLNHSFSKIGTPNSKETVLPSGSTYGSVSKQNIVHRGISCDECQIADICGIRYKCNICSNYDLCELCYHGKKHYLTHSFRRIDLPRSGGVILPPRSANNQTQDAVHNGITCDACNAFNIVGLRYKCKDCWNYDLCDKCYHNNKHKEHSFRRIDFPNAVRIDLPPRRTSMIYEEDTVYIVHRGVRCDQCKVNNISGIRYKCNDCFNYDLCNNCYHRNEHNLGHTFIKIDFPKALGIYITPRTTNAINEDRVAVHTGIFCDECYYKNKIQGMRYKCNNCRNYDLCYVCYHQGKHNLNHTFNRIDMPGSVGTDLPPRQISRKCHLRGIFEGTKVVQGIDADWDTKDEPGIVLDIRRWDNSTWRSAAYVRWKNGRTQLCRLGHQGRCDIQLVEVSPHNMYYYPEHLPLLSQNEDMEHFSQASSSVRNRNSGADGISESFGSLNVTVNETKSEENVKQLKNELEEIKQSQTCAICWEKKRDIIFLCGHGACSVCAESLSICHMCRKAIGAKIRIFEN